MDNLTHSLIGMLLAHALCPPGKLRRAAVWTGVLASNFPDIDLLLRPFFEDGKLGYLVHHRGHSHTLLAALPQAVLAAVLGAWLGRQGAWWKMLKTAGTGGLSPGTRLFLISLAGLGLHIGADSWNNYGVHPFWPLHSRWLYGDFIFIIEPLLLAVLLPWAALVPPPGGQLEETAGVSRSTLFWRRLFAALLVLLVGLTWGIPWLPWGVGLAVTGWAGFNLWLHARHPPPGVTFLALAAVLGTFLLGSHLARERMLAAFLRVAHGEELVEIGLTPQPGNPLCWQSIALSMGGPGGDEYRARLGNVSVLPGLLEPERCRMNPGPGRTVALQPLPASVIPGVSWEGRFTGARVRLLEVARLDCRVRAFMRFARSPWWDASPEGLQVGDLRYDYEPDAGFAELGLANASAWKDCDGYLPAWSSAAAERLGF